MTKNKTAHMTFLMFALITVLSLTACAGSNTEVFSTSYGTMDFSSAEKGYASFTAKGGEYTLILQDPEGSQTLLDVQEGIPLAIPLCGGNGTYHFAVSSRTSDGNCYRILYKNSADIRSLQKF